LDERTDIYSLGVVLYELVTGVAPFDEPTVTGLLTAVLRDPIQPPRVVRTECPEELEAIILRAMSRNRDERFASAAEMEAALAKVADDLDWPEGRDAWLTAADTSGRASATPQL